MNSIISDLIQKQAEPEPSKPSGFDYLTKLVVPLLALVALIVADFRQERTLMWALLGVTVLSLLVGFLSRAAGWTKVRAGARRDERFARRAFPALRKLVERFGDFADQSHCNTVHYVALHELSQGRSDLFGKLGIPSVNFFRALWSNLSDDIAAQKPTLGNFKTTIALEPAHLPL